MFLLQTVSALAFSPDRPTWLAAATAGGQVLFGDVSTRKFDAAVPLQHTGAATALAFSTVNSKLLISAGMDGKLFCIDVALSKYVRV